jgi:ethanolamine utilization protein EutQ
MPKQLFTAADIRYIARNQNHDLLILSPDDIITPEAIDVACTLGLRLVREEPSSRMDFIAATTTVAEKSSQLIPLPPLKMVFGEGVILDPFGEGLATSGTKVRLKDVLTSADGSSMAVGYMALDQGEFPWTLTYDEVDIVLEGELVITRGTEAASAKPGDVIFIPKGSSITFGTPGKVRFIYVAFPANWNEKR